MNRTHTGIASGVVATISLSEVSLYLGLCATILTLLCLLPQTVMNWRRLKRDYTAFSIDTKKSGFVYFILYCAGVFRPLPTTKDPFQ